MDSAELRSLFRAFVGDNRCRRFVHQLHFTRKRRLLYWQQDLWDEFVERNPHAKMSLEALKAHFQFCEVHNCDLVPQDREINMFQRSMSVRDWGQLPYAVGVQEGEQVFFCPDCRGRAEQWLAIPRAERSAELKKTILG
jgi:hypothetical protein